jgi:hypothetical protein
MTSAWTRADVPLLLKFEDCFKCAVENGIASPEAKRRLNSVRKELRRLAVYLDPFNEKYACCLGCLAEIKSRPVGTTFVCLVCKKGWTLTFDKGWKLTGLCI